MTDQPNLRLDTRAAADYLAEHGFKMAAATLNKYRCIGGGPKFDLFGRKPLYRPELLLEWATARTKFNLRSTSEAEAA
jgi:hypothetical protein